MDWKASLGLFFVVIVGTCVIPFVGLDESKEHQNNEPIVVQQTNSIPAYLERTNSVDRAGKTPNVDWFKQSSTYVWDGWKIK